MAPRGKKTRAKNVTKKKNSIADVAGDLTQNAETVSPSLPEKDISKNYFRRLPIEIRQMIYALAVIDQDVIEPLQVENRSNKFCGGQTAAKAFSSLLLTCRMFREELQDRPDFYQENTFRFNSYQNLATFLAALSPAHRSMVRNIRFAIKGWRPPCELKFLQSAATLLSHCTSFRSLSIIASVNVAGTGPGLIPHAYFAFLLREFQSLCSSSMHLGGNDWRRLRTQSVQHFEILFEGWSLKQGHRTFLVGGLGASADHGNLRFSGEQGFVDTDAGLVDLVQRLNSHLLELGTFCRSKYVINKPIFGRRFQEALVCLELDVFGDNRACQSHQSCMVSHGTRSRTQRAKQLSSNGVLPRVTENPKYIDTYESEDSDCIFDD
ncbi:Putative 2EXR domain-containing protein [Colletotrichum destructivum]|uniref:2EXR domain-containing protein n=1 Tax=Colletotrichum destructivum TaxID=34406 RepID=A0AAX4HY24_9PEZI|nr:Putative 2EXR domain-containing protein [Colletotrichum destructivum]